MSIEFAPLDSYNVGNLEVSRMKAISVIAHGVRQACELDDTGSYFADIQDINKQHTYTIWQAYATDFSSEGRMMMIDALETDSRWRHPSQQRPDREIGSLAIGLIRAELDVRKEAYQVVLPGISTVNLEISKREEDLVRRGITESWLLTEDGYKYNQLTVASFTKKILMTRLLRQLIAEESLLLANTTANFI